MRCMHHVIKTHACQELVFILCSLGQQMLSRFFFKTIQIRKCSRQMLLTLQQLFHHSLLHYVSHLPNHSTTFFSSSQVEHWSAEIQTKVYNPRKEVSTNWPIDQVSKFALATKFLFRILQNSHKKSSECTNSKSFPGEGYSLEFLVGVCRPHLQIQTQF